MTAPATWRHRKKSGELIDVEIYWSPIEFEGHPASLAMLSDTTDRKLAEKRLHHQARSAPGAPRRRGGGESGDVGRRGAAALSQPAVVLTGYRSGHIYLLGNEPDLLVPTKLWYLSDPQRFEVVPRADGVDADVVGHRAAGSRARGGPPDLGGGPESDRNFPRRNPPAKADSAGLDSDPRRLVDCGA